MNAQLPYDDAVRAATDPLYERVRGVIPELEWPVFAPYIAAINALKAERNAVILAHNYQTPEIFHGVADLTGDSLALARMAAETDADVIVMCGVHFMAETAKLLNPDKVVLIPDSGAGCSLADSITAEDVRELKRRHPGAPVVTYVNTSAPVKAEADICCTSGNAVAIVESLDSDQVIFIPDEYLGRWVQTQTTKELIFWKGHCEVHERFTPADLAEARRDYPGIEILAHPECPGDVLDAADFVGSTSQMNDYVATRQLEKVMLITECSMSDNVAVENPNTNFIRPCNMCPHMKKITLPKILRALQNLEERVEVDDDVADAARSSVERMLAVPARQPARRAS